MAAFWQWLEGAGAQHDVVEWARPYDGDLEALWRECPRGDWLLVIAARLEAPRKPLVRAACACARLALSYVPEDPQALRQALSTAETWCDDGLAAGALQLQREAVGAALDAAADPAESAAIVAASCALDAIDAADAAVNAAAFAVQAAVLDAGDCAMMEAMRFTQRRSAQLVRENLDAETIARLWDARAPDPAPAG